MIQQTPPILIQPFVLAVENKQWTMFVALCLGGFVALSKQGWFSAWMAEKLNTPLKTQLYALGVGMAAAFSIDGVAGKNLVTCIEDAINIVIMAVFLHQFVIKGILKGQEPIPATKKVAETRVLDAQLHATLNSVPPPPPSTVPTIPVPKVGPVDIKDKS